MEVVDIPMPEGKKTLEDRIKVDYEGRYRTAFENAVALIVARNNHYESTTSLCRRFNDEYNLSGNRRLRRRSVEAAARARVAFVVTTLRSAPRDGRTSKVLHAAAVSTVHSPARSVSPREESVYYTEEDLQTFTGRMQKEGLMAGGEIFIDPTLLEGSDITPDDPRWEKQVCVLGKQV